MNNEIFKIVGSVLLEDEAFVNGIKNIMNKAEETSNKLAEKFNQIGDTISNAGTKMTLGLTTPIAGLTTAGIKYNMEMESLETNLATLLGSTEKAQTRLHELRTMGAKTPFETTDLVKATQKMLAFGLDATKTNGYLQMLGDIAMGDANKLDSLTLAFSQIGASGRASMEDINQMIDQGFNPLTYVAKKTGESMADVRQRVSDGAVSFEEIASAMTDATSKGGAFYGSMDKASETTAGRISTLKDNIGVMLGTLTSSLMPIFEQIVDKLAEWVGWFSNLDASTQSLIMKVLLFVASLGPALFIIGKLVSGVGTVISIFGKLKTALALVKTTMAGLNLTFLASPITWIVLAIAGLIAILVVAYNNSETFRQAVNDLWTAIKENLLKAFEEIKPVLQEVINALVELWNAVMEFVVPIFEWVVGLIKQYMPLIKAQISTSITWISTILKNLLTIVKGAFNLITNAIKTALNVIKNVIKLVTSLIKGDWEGVWKAIKNIFTSVFTGIKNSASTILSTIKNIFVNSWNAIKSSTSKIWNGIKDSVTKPVKDAMEKVEGYIGKIKSAFNNFTAKLKMPHIKITNGSWNPKDWIENGIPKFSVEWYAKGGIFDEPTIFSTPSGLKGVGEAGPEAVTPISKLQDYIKIANKESDSGIAEKIDLLIEILLKYLPYLMARQNVVLDNGVLVGQLISDIDIELGKLKNRRKRG